MKPEDISDGQIQYIQKLVDDIQSLGPGALLAQYCNWANLVVETINDKGRGAIVMRSEQAMALVWFLRSFVKDDDVETIMKKLKESVTRALMNAKLQGREQIGLDDAELAMRWVVDELKALSGN